MLFCLGIKSLVIGCIICIIYSRSVPVTLAAQSILFLAMALAPRLHRSRILAAIEHIHVDMSGCDRRARRGQATRVVARVTAAGTRYYQSTQHAAIQAVLARLSLCSHVHATLLAVIVNKFVVVIPKDER